MNAQQLKAYEIVSSYGEHMPIHSLHRAYIKGQADRDLYWLQKWTKKDEGKSRSRFKSAVEDIVQTDMKEILRGNGFFQPVIDQGIPTTSEEGAKQLFCVFLVFFFCTLAVIAYWGWV